MGVFSAVPGTADRIVDPHPARSSFSSAPAPQAGTEFVSITRIDPETKSRHALPDGCSPSLDANGPDRLLGGGRTPADSERH
jgi:hypothetical protein